MNDSSESIVLETTRRIMADLADPQTINATRDTSWKAPLWRALEENGLTLAWVSDEFGGAGASIADGFDVLRIAGQYAAPVALSETLLAGWLLASSGQSCPAGPVTVAPVRERDKIELGGDGVHVELGQHGIHVDVAHDDGRGLADDAAEQPSVLLAFALGHRPGCYGPGGLTTGYSFPVGWWAARGSNPAPWD